MFRRGNWEIVPDLRQLASRDAGEYGDGWITWNGDRSDGTIQGLRWLMSDGSVVFSSLWRCFGLIVNYTKPLWALHFMKSQVVFAQ
jgi:hypothetical protein